MADPWTTIVAALIGAGLGSLGSKIYETRSRQSAEREAERREVVDRYLLQLQEGVDDLWYRLDNLHSRGGKNMMANEYFEISTLYTLGRVLAFERIFLLDGIYSQLERLYPGVGLSLRTRLRDLDQKLTERRFQRYDRLALAESVLERADGYLHVSTYLEFKRRYTPEESLERTSLESARTYIVAMTYNELSGLLTHLQSLANYVAGHTGLSSTIKSPTEKPSSDTTDEVEPHK